MQIGKQGYFSNRPLIPQSQGQMYRCSPAGLISKRTDVALSIPEFFGIDMILTVVIAADHSILYFCSYNSSRQPPLASENSNCVSSQMCVVTYPLQLS